MTDFQDFDILSLINDRPGWEIGMQDDEDLDIPGKADQKNKIPNCFANDESLKSQSYSNFDMKNFASNEQHDNGDATDEYGDNSDQSDNDNSDSDNDSVKSKSAVEESNDSDDGKNEVSFTSDEEEEAGDSDGNEKVDRNNSDEEVEGSGDANSDDRSSLDEPEEGDSDTDDDKSMISKGSVDAIQEQLNEHFSDVSDNDVDILEGGNEEVKEESDKEYTEEEKEEDNDFYDTEDVIVVQFSDISNDESEKDQLSEDEEGNSGLADQNDAGGNDDDVSINSTDNTKFNNIEDGNETDEYDNDKLSDVSFDDGVSKQESVGDEDVRSEEDDKMSNDEDQDNDGDAEWSDADENDTRNDCINDNKIARIKTVKVDEFVDINNGDSNESLDGDSSADESENFDKESGKESDAKTKKDIATMEETESPFGFVIGDVVGVSQEEFDRQDSSNVSATRESLPKQEDSTGTVEKDQDNQDEGNQNNTKPVEDHKMAPMEVELTLPSVYPRVESYHSDNYLFGNAPIKQEPMDDDDYIQEHDYFGQTSTLEMDNQSIPELGTDELGLEAGELLTYQDMFDITATGQYKCKYCSAKLGTFKSLKIHIDRCHQKSYKCQQCDEVFTRSQDLAGHCRIHRKEERLSNETKNKKGGKIKHQPLCKPRHSRSKNVVVEKDGQRMYRCRFCNKKFDMTQKLANHIQWKHKKERQCEQKLQATLGGKHTVTQVSLYGAKMTIKVEPANKDGSQRKQPVYSDTYQCAQCPQIFNKQQAMAVHVRNYHSKQLKNDQEKSKEESHPALKKRSKKKASKQKRLRTISEDRKMNEENSLSDTCSNLEADVTPAKQAKSAIVCPSLKCKLCSKTFQEARELKSHLNGVHAQYCCRYCPKAFYKVEKFMCHSFQHLGDLRYFEDANGEPMVNCRKCKATLPAKAEVTLKHVIGHIKGKNPSGHALSLERQVFLECSECGQPFIAREFLFKHEMKHAVSSGRVSNLKSCTRPATDGSGPASVRANTTIPELNGDPAYTNKYTVCSAPIATSGTPVTTRSEMVALPFTDQTKITTGGENTKGDDNRKVLLRSKILQTELISVTKIPFKCGMCEARFPNSQYLLHHMTLHMNGQYVFKIEVDKKKDELSKGSESSEIPPVDISSSKTTDTPATTQPSSGNQMASSIVQQLSKGSNMASIISSNISPESGDLFNSNDHNNDHTYTSKVKQPLIDSPAVTKSLTNTTVNAPSNTTPSFTKKFIILPSTTVKPSEGQTKPATMVLSTPPQRTASPIKYTAPTTHTTFDITKKLQEMLTKKEQTVTIADDPDAEVVKLPTLGTMTASTRVSHQPSEGKGIGVRMAVEKKIRELLDVYKVPPAKVPPSSRGVQTRYTSLIYPKRVMIQKSEGPTSDATTSSSLNSLVQSVTKTTSETAQSKISALSSGSNVSTIVVERPESSDIRAAEPGNTQYSDTETLSAVSESPETGSPRSISPVVGISSESDSDDLSEDEQALFEETTMSVSVPTEKQEIENASSVKGVKKDAEQHSPTPLPKVSIRNYKNQLDFAQGSWFECELCMYLCKTYKEFKNHLSSHKKSKKTKLVKCSLCPRKFISKWHLSKHMEIHRANAYSCSKCGANFRTSVSVMEHMAEECSPR
ncbi:uncharacterized protein LOC110448259 [Mizuhopecten yessoensis]|uniref:Zinc finger protein 197 n=1 Tax=Mizuhopecten yessoensis TaxID=6573 RepID=A0A210QTK2_MIZYE|nr:uncharacterized protein LOC110448259 [Mizuhopecten yessoensis]XP_021350101.1 uncharacterized protein LOC110448259 [Mizuhopecten yessoensis]OWF52071.1 Zinc finger protein 197 [Mizuhopecten yessoensis]